MKTDADQITERGSENLEAVEAILLELERQKADPAFGPSLDEEEL